MVSTSLLDRAVVATVPAGRVLLIGTGDEYHHDDAVGPEVIARLCRAGLAVAVPVSDGERLRERWRDADVAIVVSAVRADPAHAGRLHTYITERVAPGPDAERDVVNLLTGAPRRVVVYEVTGGAFAWGCGLSPTVAETVELLVAHIADQLAVHAPTSSARAGAA